MVPTRSKDSDFVTQAIKTPLGVLSIVTPISLYLIREEGNMLETTMEMLLDQKKIGLR